MPTTIPDIQSLSGWGPVTGPSIGPVPPSKFEITQQARGLVSSLLIAVAGVPGKYADGMAKSSAIPLPAGTMSAKFSTTFALDADSLTNTQAIELGIKFTLANGLTLNGQIQFDYSTNPENMVIDVVNREYTWSSIGVSLPKFALGVLHLVDIEYEITESSISVISITVDGVLYETPASLLNLPGQQLGWGKNQMIVGFQPDVNTKGGPFEWEIYDASLVLN